MFRALRGLRIGTRVILFGISITALFVMAYLVFVLPSIRRNAEAGKISALKQATEIVAALVTQYQQRVDKGEFSREEGQKRALSRTENLRFGEGNYFWIQDTTPRMLMHPVKPEMNGKEVGDNRDANGLLFFQEMTKVAKTSGEGVVRYAWPKPGSDQPVAKVSYIRLIPGWDWVVGTGVYLDDVEQTVREETRSMMGVYLAITLLGLLLATLIAKNIGGTIRGLLGEVDGLARAAGAGRLATRAAAQNTHFEFRPIVEGFNHVLDAVIGPLNVAADYVDRIAKGDIPPKISDSYNGDFNAIKNNLNACIDAVNALVADARSLSQAAVEGRLSTRADASRHQGDFRKVVEGVNTTLDAVIGPLNVAANYVDRIAKGAIPSKISDSYNGDFNAIKNNLNTCIDAIRGLVEDVNLLAKAAVEGQLSTRADASRHQGDFRKIVEGVNHTLDAVLAPINEASAVLENLSQRDLRARMKGEYQGDHARIKEAVNQTATALHEAIGQVAGAVDQVSAAAGQIASASQTVADGASQQASALEETSSSLESMNTMSKRTADNASQANSLAQTAKSAALAGNSAVEQMSAAMSKIKSSAEGTSQIIKDINEIAFQTNLLALNAAVEAARAGETGRGFAVVAEEVRSLALRSKEAAMKTEALIRESVRQAGEGEGTSRKMADKLNEILEGIDKVNGIVNEISASAKEQSAGVDQINRAVADMNKVTQQNAANSEESSSAAAELSSQSEELAAMVGSFQLSQAGGSPAHIPATTATPARAKRPSATAKPEALIPLDGDPAFRDF